MIFDQKLQISFLILISLFGFSFQQSFSFPKQWRAQVWGTVIDAFTSGKTVQSAGWFYSDYTTQAQRADEVWNQTSIAGTEIPDTHLFVGQSGYFYYYNNTGPQCAPQPALLIPQVWPKSSYVKETKFNGQPASEFQITNPTFGVTLTLVTDSSQKSPFFFRVDLPAFSLTSVTYLTTFESTFFSQSEWNILFKPPSYCS